MKHSAPSALETIYQLGERMQSALEDGRMETFFALAEERTLLIDRLRDADNPAAVDPDWEHWATQLAEQHYALERAVEDGLQHMTETLHRVERLKNAHQQYRKEPPPSSDGVLNQHLTV